MVEYYCEQCHQNCVVRMDEKPERVPYVCPVEAIRVCRWVEKNETE